VPHELEARIAHQVRDIQFRAGVKVINTQNIVALPDESLAQVRAEKSGSAGDHDPLVSPVALHVFSSFPAARQWIAGRCWNAQY
jgi:hypothetical protein